MESSLNDIWRSIVLRGKNVASYKFALAEALIELAKKKKLSNLTLMKIKPYKTIY